MWCSLIEDEVKCYILDKRNVKVREKEEEEERALVSTCSVTSQHWLVNTEHVSKVGGGGVNMHRF